MGEAAAAGQSGELAAQRQALDAILRDRESAQLFLVRAACV